MLVKSKNVEVGSIDNNIFGDGVVTGHGTINGNDVGIVRTLQFMVDL